MEHAPLLLDFQLNSIMKDKPQTPIEKTKTVKEIIPLLQEINNEIVQSEYVRMIANTLNIDENALMREIKNHTGFHPHLKKALKKLLRKIYQFRKKRKKFIERFSCNRQSFLV